MNIAFTVQSVNSLINPENMYLFFVLKLTHVVPHFFFLFLFKVLVRLRYLRHGIFSLILNHSEIHGDVLP